MPRVVSSPGPKTRGAISCLACRDAKVRSLATEFISSSANDASAMDLAASGQRAAAVLSWAASRGINSSN